MDTIDKSEADRDDAAAELRQFEERVYEECKDLWDAVDRIANIAKVSSAGRRSCKDAIADAISDLVYDAKAEIEGRLSEAQDALSHAESIDERRSAPVVI